MNVKRNLDSRLCYIPVSLVDALEEALRHLAGLDDDRPELPRHVHDVGLGRAHHPSQALLMQGNVTVSRNVVNPHNIAETQIFCSLLFI